MAKIHFIGGEKGGVGKSLLARVLAQYFIDHEMPFLGFDTDRSHGALLRFYEGYASPVVMDHYEALDVVVEAAADQPARRILVDLAAQTHEPLVKWMEDTGVVNMASEIGITIFYWHVMDAGKDSVDLLEKLLDQFGPRLGYVLVRNQLRGDDFSLLEKSGQQARALALGAKVITLKRLHDAVVNKIDASNASFWAARHNTGTGLGLMERQRLKIWFNHAQAEIAAAGV